MLQTRQCVLMHEKHDFKLFSITKCYKFTENFTRCSELYDMNLKERFPLLDESSSGKK